MSISLFVFHCWSDTDRRNVAIQQCIWDFCLLIDSKTNMCIFFSTQNHDVWETTCSMLLWCLKTINTRTDSVTCLNCSAQRICGAKKPMYWPCSYNSGLQSLFQAFITSVQCADHMSCTRPAWPVRTQCYYLLDLSINATQYWLRACVCVCVWKCDTSVGGYTFILVAD